jgi:hypothetical protein
MAQQRKYNNATLAGLMTLCRGYCYWPGCTSRVITMVNGVPKLNAEIAHIRAISPGGKRFDPKWSVPERNSFKNLLLLCVPHHTTIDGASSDDYPVELLEEWKASREGESVEALEGLTGLTETRLGEMLAEAQGQFLDQVRPALAEFSKTARSWPASSTPCSMNWPTPASTASASVPTPSSCSATLHGLWAASKTTSTSSPTPPTSLAAWRTRPQGC